MTANPIPHIVFQDLMVEVIAQQGVELINYGNQFVISARED